MDKQTLPIDSNMRKNIPLAGGLFAYFPEALAYVAYVSKRGNDKHNPGQPVHWARGKSDDHEDCILRHSIDAGKFDDAGILHTGSRAWRALAALQLEIEARGGLEAVLRHQEQKENNDKAADDAAAEKRNP